MYNPPSIVKDGHFPSLLYSYLYMGDNDGGPDSRSQWTRDLEAASQLESIRTQLSLALAHRKRAQEFLNIRKDFLTKFQTKLATTPGLQKVDIVPDLTAWAAIEEELFASAKSATDTFDTLVASYSLENLDEDVLENDPNQAVLDAMSDEYEAITHAVADDIMAMEPLVIDVRRRITRL